MSEQNKPSPITATLAGGLVTGLGFSVVGSRIWTDLEVSQSLTMLVIGVGFVVGAAATFAIVSKRSGSAPDSAA